MRQITRSNNDVAKDASKYLPLVRHFDLSLLLESGGSRSRSNGGLPNIRQESVIMLINILLPAYRASLLVLGLFFIVRLYASP